MKSKLRLIGLFLISMSLWAGSVENIAAGLRTEVVGSAVDIVVIVLVLGGLIAAFTGRFMGLVGVLIGGIIAVGADRLVPWLQSLT